jgi:hypothetical protein
MAHTSGTASNYADLMDRFVTFVTTGLVSGQNWTKLADHTTEPTFDRNVYFQAPGLAGTDAIFVNMASSHSVGADVWNVGFWGATGFNAALGGIGAQPGAAPTGSWMLLWDTAIPYWFIADGRSARIIAKASTVYESAYAGLFIPYASPSEYAYPYFVGAMASNQGRRFSDTSNVHSAFWNPASDGNNTLGVDSHSGAWLRLPGGNWVPAGNFGGNNAQNLCVWPYGRFENIGQVLGGTDYSLMPLVLHTGGVGLPDSLRANFGELDSVFFISGFSNASENLVTIGGVTYIVVQNGFRTTAPNGTTASNTNSYAAFALN